MVEDINKKLVVCVEDDEHVRDALQGLLRANGMLVATFASADEFLNSAELQNAACLVTDIQLGGISGLDLLERLVTIAKRIPSILITAHSDVAAGERATSSGAIAIFQKPVDPTNLMNAIRRALQKAPGP